MHIIHFKEHALQTPPNPETLNPATPEPSCKPKTTLQPQNPYLIKTLHISRSHFSELTLKSPSIDPYSLLRPLNPKQALHSPNPTQVPNPPQ